MAFSRLPAIILFISHRFYCWHHINNKLKNLLLAGDTQIYVSQNQALLSIFLFIIPTIVKLSCMIEKNRKSMGKGGGVACHPKPKRLFSGTMRTIHNCHCYTRPHLTTFHTLPIFIALPAPSSSCCHLTMKIKVLQFLQCKGLFSLDSEQPL